MVVVVVGSFDVSLHLEGSRSRSRSRFSAFSLEPLGLALHTLYRTVQLIILSIQTIECA